MDEIFHFMFDVYNVRYGTFFRRLISIGTLIALKACFMNNAKKTIAFYVKFGKQKH